LCGTVPAVPCMFLWLMAPTHTARLPARVCPCCRSTMPWTARAIPEHLHPPKGWCFLKPGLHTPTLPFQGTLKTHRWLSAAGLTILVLGPEQNVGNLLPDASRCCSAADTGHLSSLSFPLYTPHLQMLQRE